MDKFYTIQELADLFNLDYMTVYKRVVDGRIQAVKFGTQWRISEDEVNKIKREGA